MRCAIFVLAKVFDPQWIANANRVGAQCDKIWFHETRIRATRAEAHDPTNRLTLMDISKDWDFDQSGYKNMCRFHSIEVWKYLVPYEFAMRMDQDIFIRELRVDLWSWMRRHGVDYAYGRRKVDSHRTTRDTYVPFVHTLLGSKTRDDWPIMNYYNNLFVTRPQFWAQPVVQRFLQQVNTSGGIFKHRWGDSNIQATILRHLSANVRMIPNISYSHGSHNFVLYSDRRSHEW